MTTPPPKPPPMSLLSIDKDGNLCAPKPSSFRKWKHPASSVTIHTVDQGGRLTLARAVTLGVFALGAKKRKVSVVLVTDQGETFAHEVNGKSAETTLAWAVAFNAWRETVTRSDSA